MKVLCNKVISSTTGEDLGESSPFLKRGKEYTVLAVNYCETSGFYICIQTENYNEPCFIPFVGFEFINEKMPSSWVTVFSESYGRKVMNLLPASWNYDSFFEDVDDEKPAAVALFNKEAEKIYREEGLID
jgi:hypothetical protein